MNPQWKFLDTLDCKHYIISAMASQITGVTIAYSTVCSGVDQRKHQSSTSLPFVRVIHRRHVNSSHKGPVTQEMFPVQWWRQHEYVENIFVYFIRRFHPYSIVFCHVLSNYIYLPLLILLIIIAIHPCVIIYPDSQELCNVDDNARFSAIVVPLNSM